MVKKISGGPRKKIALVCSGGAAKAAAFHMGVCLALQEHGFTFLGGLKKKTKTRPRGAPLEIDTYVGSSAGSFISSYLVAGYTVEDIFRSYLYPRRKTNKLKAISYSTLLSLRPSLHEEGWKAPLTKKLHSLADMALNFLYLRKGVLVPGVFSTSGIEQYLRSEVLPSNNFKAYEADLFIVATQLNHSKRVIFNKYDIAPPLEDKSCKYDSKTNISDAVAASTALPPIFSPYAIKNKSGNLIHYFDGEIRETLSVHAAEDRGADLIIASYTHQPYHYSKEIGSLINFGLTAIAIQAIYLLVERKIQSAIYNREQKRVALDAVQQYCKSSGISERQRKKLTAILEEKLGFRPDNHYLYIHPLPTDHEMFFGDHFNLNSKYMENIVRIGFRYFPC